MDKFLEKSYKNKSVLVTGHTGFKGSWLCILLLELGANVIGYSLDPYSQRDNFVLTHLNDKIVDIRGDIRDKDKLNRIFIEHKPDFVFHLAAQPLVRLAYDKPDYTYDVNIMGTVNLLEAIRRSETTMVGIIITSDKCYENKEWVWGYRENDPMGGYDPYSASKGCVELVVSSYSNSFFNSSVYLKHKKAISTVRAGNVIGGGDWSDSRIVPDCIKALESGTDIIVRNPNSIRPWQHVLEPLSGYLLLGARMVDDYVSYCGAWNFGPDPENVVDVESIVKKVIKHWGNGSLLRARNVNELRHEANLLNLDISKAKYELKWSPRWNIDKTIDKTVEWYKHYNKGNNVYDICARQIDEYFMSKKLDSRS